MELKTTPVNKCLDKKMLMLGFEIPDLILLLLTISTLNLLFSSSRFGLTLIWVPSILLAAILKIGKKGKPENYLLHSARFLIRPGVLHAFKDPSVDQPSPKLNKKGL